MEKSDFNLKQEAPETHQICGSGDAQCPDNEIQGKASSKPPTTEPSASNGRQYPTVSASNGRQYPTFSASNGRQYPTVSASNGRQPPACRYFLRGFCRNGNACRFHHAGSQASDSSTANGTSSDDRVCRFYRLGRCRYGDSCRFLHTLLPAIEEDQEDEDEGELDALKIAALLRRAKYLGGLTQEAVQEDLEQRFRNCGFNDEEVLELASHGVKPWDYEADAVLDVLNNRCDYGLSYDYSDLGDEDFDVRSPDPGNSNNGED